MGQYPQHLLIILYFNFKRWFGLYGIVSTSSLLLLFLVLYYLGSGPWAGSLSGCI